MHALPLALVQEIASQSNLRIAVETGTFLGDSAALLRSHFDEVFTIELSAELHVQAQQRHSGTVGITFLQGSSADVLPKLVADLGAPALYWLDGHWTPGAQVDGIAGAEHQCPLLAEIAAIDDSPWSQDACILIDDARLFLGPPPPPHRRSDFPTFIEVVDLLRARFDRYVTVLEDVIIAGPPQIQAAVDTYWLSALARGEDTRSRLASALNPSRTVAAKRFAAAVLPPGVTAKVRTSLARRAGSPAGTKGRAGE